MTLLQHHELQPFWDLAGAQVKIKALEIALSKSLFDLLLSPSTVEEVAYHESFVSSLNAKNTEIWLDLLWSMGCLEKTVEEKAQYSTSEMAKRYLVKSSLLDCSQAINFRFQTLKGFADQFEQMLDWSDQDRGIDPSSNMAPLWANAAKAQIFQEQRSVMVPALNKIIDLVISITDGLLCAESDLEKMHFLDLGGGPGLASLALAKRFPDATGVVFDFPETVEVAGDNILAAGVQSRVSVQSGDLNITQPEGVFDLIWCSSVLHFLDNADATIARIARLLKTNGILLILHAEQTFEKNHCARVLPFYLPMVMKGNYLPRQGEIPEMLNHHGINLIMTEEIVCFPMAPVWLHFGRKLA
ncbi:class I SAM-dependent methyltransferase [Marinomonas primoryensis]|uniref:class I SAM-dependent methyltransferase n=1 Tax=Marinomonas primoryensis TaxID=178399 RepID=UPI0030DBB148|tara:strand:+ start:4019 stop:5089 length:1071 start_codon:yes stop_codon:yes gene_type:complete